MKSATSPAAMNLATWIRLTEQDVLDLGRLNQVFKLVHDLKLLSKMLGVELVDADRNLADHPPLSEMGLADLASQ